MRIYVIANFAGSLNGATSNRFSYLAECLAVRGHLVKLIVSSFFHGTKSPRPAPKEEKYHFGIVQCEEPGYKTNVCLQRFFSHYVWGKNVEHYLKRAEKPDVIYCAIPSLTASVRAARFCKKNDIRFVVDLQDLWPEGFTMVIKNKILQKAFMPIRWYVEKAYASADLAVGVSETFVERILSVNKNLNSGISVFLGHNYGEFEDGCKKYHLERNENEIVIGYIGNMSIAYDMLCVFDALSEVKKRGKVTVPVRFVLIGGGVDEDKYKKYANRVYPNTQFLGWKNYREMAGMLSGVDIVINPITKGAGASIINKVGDYAMSGKPVINTQESPEYRKLVDNYRCGINCECGDSVQVADAIERLALNPQLRHAMGENHKILAKEMFDRRYTYHKIIEAVEGLSKINVKIDFTSDNS